MRFVNLSNHSMNFPNPCTPAVEKETPDKIRKGIALTAATVGAFFVGDYIGESRATVQKQEDQIVDISSSAIKSDALFLSMKGYAERLLNVLDQNGLDAPPLPPYLSDYLKIHVDE